MTTKKRSPSHKIALLGGEDFRNEHGRFTLYTVDGQNILLAYSEALPDGKLKEITPEAVRATEMETGAMVITRTRWGKNMTEQWQKMRERVLWLVENTTIYVVVDHYPQAYSFEAIIKDVRLDAKAAAKKNQGRPFRTREAAVRYCNNNNIKIRG